MKAAFTQQAFQGASECLQVFGGHGYVREWGIEQIVRDARVAMIYEGTNEIQAIDLLVRKVLADGGTGLWRCCYELRADLDPSHAPDALALRQFAALGELTLELTEAARPGQCAGLLGRRRLPARRGRGAAGLGLVAHRSRTRPPDARTGLALAGPCAGPAPLGAAGVRHASGHHQDALH